MRKPVNHRNIVILTLLWTLVLSGCRKEDPEVDCTPPPPTTGTLQINFVAGYGGNPFLMNSDYLTAWNQRIRVQDFKFLATEFWTRNSNNDSLYLHESFKYNLSVNKTSFTVEMNPGTYTGLGFALGVMPSKDHLDPTVFPPSSDLSYNVSGDLHWGWSTGYIFTMFGGLVDTTNGGTGSLNNTFAFHAGHDSLYSPLPFFNKNYTITTGNTTVINIDVDVYAFLHSATDSIDLRVDRVTHTNDNFPLAWRFMQMYKQAFNIP